jgi:hypothetical protein
LLEVKFSATESDNVLKQKNTKDKKHKLSNISSLKTKNSIKQPIAYIKIKTTKIGFFGFTSSPSEFKFCYGTRSYKNRGVFV